MENGKVFDLKAEGQELQVLNLYSGLGGNRKNWEGVKVTAVEMEPDIADVYRTLFPNDAVIVGDAHQYLLDHSDEFDFVWTSPPCQTHSRMMKATRHKKKRYTDMSLYQEILFLQHFFKGKWVVENVKPYYDPLVRPSAILGRHYFWSNFRIGKFEIENFPNFIQDDTHTNRLCTTNHKNLSFFGCVTFWLENPRSDTGHQTRCKHRWLA